jgi:hypothetical protein
MAGAGEKLGKGREAGFRRACCTTSSPTR